MVSAYMNKYKSSIKKIDEYVKEISKLPIGGIIRDLKRMEINRKNLEKRMNEIDIKIVSIKSIEKVAEHLVMEDKVGRALFFELRKEGNISYKDLIRDYDESAKTITSHYIKMLKNAKLIDMEMHPSGRPTIIKVTKKGMANKYRGKK